MANTTPPSSPAQTPEPAPLPTELTRNLCRICKRVLLINACLKDHLRAHFEEHLPTAIEKCIKVVTVKRKITTVASTSITESLSRAPVPCTKCEATFKDYTTRDTHNAIFHCVDPQHCVMCGITFNTVAMKEGHLCAFADIPLPLPV